MPYYLITIRLQDGKKVQGIKVHSNSNIDAMYNFYHNQAVAFYRRDLKDFDCVIVAKQSKAYRKWIESKNNKKADNWMDNIPDFNENIDHDSRKKQRPEVSNWAKGIRSKNSPN